MFGMDLGNLLVHLTAENSQAVKAFHEYEVLISNTAKTLQPFTKAVKSAFETAAIASMYAVDAMRNYEISAKKIFSSVSSAISKIGDAFESVKNAGEKAFNAIKKSVEVFIAPLKYAIEAMIAWKGALWAAGMASVKAAGDEEKLHQRLVAIIGDVQTANQLFRESKDMEGYFDMQNLVNARIMLQMTGIHGTEAMNSIANAAVALDSDIETIATGLKRMDAGVFRGLWQYGVELKQDGNRFLFKFRDQMGELRTIAAQGASAAQQEMLKIFDMKFGNAYQTAKQTLPGLFRILTESIHNLRVDFGEGLLAPVKLIIQDMIDGIHALKEGAKSAGETLGQELLKARAGLLAGFQVAYQIAQQIGKALDKQGIGSVILESIRLGVTILTDGILAAFKASLSLWKLIGSILGNAVMEVLYSSGIPGLRGIGKQKREADISRSLSGLSDKELAYVAQPFGIQATGVRESTQGLMSLSNPQLEEYQKTRAQMLKELSDTMSNLSPDLLTKQFQMISKDVGREVTLDIGYNVTQALEDAKTSVSKSVDELGTKSLAALQAFENRIAAMAGEAPIDVAKTWKDLYIKNLDEGKERIEAMNSAFKDVQQTITQGAYAANVPFTDGELAMDAMLRDLQDEQELIGLTNRERERTVALIRFAQIAEKEYGKDTAAYYEKILEYQRELDKLQRKQRGPAAFTVQLEQWADDAANMWENLGQITTRALDDMSYAITDMVNNGKADFRGLAVVVLQELQRMIIKMIMAKVLMTALGMAGFGGGGAATSASSSTTSIGGGTSGGMNMFGAAVAHEGGIVGMINQRRMVPVSIFNNAPRLHTGLAPDEFPTILQRGERVTSKADVERESKTEYRDMTTATVVEPKVNLKMVNVMDKNQMIDAMSSSAGEKTIINAIKRNKGIISGLMK